MQLWDKERAMPKYLAHHELENIGISFINAKHLALLASC